MALFPVKTAILIAASAALGLSAAAYLTLPSTDAPMEITLPTGLESSSVLPPVTTPAPLDVTISPGSISFGALRPGSQSGTVEIQVLNAGAWPVRVEATASAMVDAATGASFPADAIHIEAGASGEPPLLGAGANITLRLRLDVPSGAEQWVPAGAYAGGFTLHLQEVRP